MGGRVGVWVVVGCFLLSGASGLLYEVLWARYLTQFMGASSLAHTAVLATFMGGLGLGNHLFGRIADSTRRPLWVYGVLELGVGAYGLCFHWLFGVLAAGYLALGGLVGPTSGWVVGLKIGLGVLVILGPATLMGGTMPLLSRWLITAPDQIGQGVGRLYFVNTAGAVLGCWLGGFVLIEAWGLQTSVMVTAVVNVLVGAAAMGLHRFQPAPEVDASVEAVRPEVLFTATQARVALVATGVAGGLTMLYELVWIRLVGFTFGSSSQSFSVMLVTFIAGIALGGLVAARLLRGGPRRALLWFGVCEVGIALSVWWMVPVYERFPWVFASVRGWVSRSDGGFALLQFLEAGLLFGLMFLPTVLMGTALPLATRVVVGRVDEVGRGVGRTFAVNTFGAVVGASATGLLLMPALGIQWTLTLGIALSAVLGVFLVASAFPGALRRPVPWVSGVLVVALAVGSAAWSWDPVLLTAGFFRGKRVPETFADFKASHARHKMLFNTDGPDTTVTVIEVDEAIFLKVNGKADASTLREDMVTQLISGHLPMMLHSGDPTEALVIGLGSGVTAGAVLQHPDAHVDVVELSEAVVEGARFFDPANRGVIDDPRADLHIGDAKDFLLLGPADRYDVIISEPSNPWISGVANLFSLEFFRSLRRALREDGLYLQWLQLYAFSDEAFTRSLNTLRAAFPHVTVWRFTRADCLIVASQRPIAPDMAKMKARFEAPAVAADLGPGRPIPLGGPLDLLAHQVLSSQLVDTAFPGRGPLNTDAHPYLEYEAPRAMLRGQSPDLINDLDERLDPRARERLVLGTLLGSSTPTFTEAHALRQTLARTRQKPLIEAYEAALRSREPFTESLEIEDLRSPSPGGALTRAVRDRLSASTPIPAESCTALTGMLARHLISAANAFLPPSTAQLDALVRRCASQHPQQKAAFFRSLAAARFGVGDARGAFDSAREALGALDGADPEAVKALKLDILRLCGRSALELGDKVAAREAFEAILVLDPGDKESLRLLR